MPIHICTERRAAPRHVVFKPIAIASRQAVRRMHLLNLSETGAMVYGAHGLETGSDITVRLDAGTAEARVAWRSRKHIGIAFVDPLPAELLDRFLQRNFVAPGAQSAAA